MVLSIKKVCFSVVLFCMIAINTAAPKASADYTSQSDFAPTITKVEKFPDQNLAIIHWQSPLITLDNGEISDYAYKLVTPLTTVPTWTYFDLGYKEDSGDFQYSFNSLVRCNSCAENTIQIAAVVDGTIQTPSDPIKIWFGSYTPSFNVTSPMPITEGFQFQLKSLKGIVGSDGITAGLEPYSFNKYETIFYGPYIYKLTSLVGSKSLKLTGPDSLGRFEVKGLKPGQTVKLTIARRPANCSIYGNTACTAIRTTSVTGSAGIS